VQAGGQGGRIELDLLEQIVQRLACLVASGVGLCELAELGEQAPQQRAPSQS